MPKEIIDQKFEQILEKLNNISTDTKDIKREIQDHSIKVAELEKEIEFIKKERIEDQTENRRQINIAHESIKSRELKFADELKERDKKQMWFTTILVGIGGILATLAGIFFGK